MLRAAAAMLMTILAISGCEISEGADPTPTATPAPTATPEPTETPTAMAGSAELDWEVESCEETADLYIARLQRLLNDVEDIGITDFAGDEQLEALQSFEEDVDRISGISDELGCEEEEMAEMIMDRIDELEADSPVGQLLLDGLSEAIENQDLFSDDES